MDRAARDEVREERIEDEIVVDAYNEEERAMGWYYYLDSNLSFPFPAQWLTSQQSTEGERVNVIGMAAEEDCLEEMFVEIEYEEDVFTALLSEIKPQQTDAKTEEAIADWHYWVDRGYEF